MADSKTLTVIPAKLGSTRLPKKNILPLGGKSLLQWAVEAAKKSGVCGTVMVSTESREVADVALQTGAEVPFMRPEHLGKDPHGVADVCKHVLEEYQKAGQIFDTLVVLLPTSPFRTAEDVRNTMTVFEQNGQQFAASVSAYESDIFCAQSMSEDGVLTSLFPDHFKTRPESRPVPYEINGAVTVANVKAFMEQGTLYGSPLYASVMPVERSVDIDTADDFRYAEYLLRKE